MQTENRPGDGHPILLKDRFRTPNGFIRIVWNSPQEIHFEFEEGARVVHKMDRETFEKHLKDMDYIRF